jgi:phosphocarrier protein HPr
VQGSSRDAASPQKASATGEWAVPVDDPPLAHLTQDVMNGPNLQRKVIVTDPLGLHMRPLAVFAQRANQYQSSVFVTKDSQRVNGKSPLELMLLAAEQGTELLLEVSGADSESAIDVLAAILASPGDEHSLPPKG